MSEIVKRLRRQLILIGMVGGDKDLKSMLEEAAAEIARLREERRWVPVGERLPQNEEWVDIAGEWGDCVGYYSVGRWLNVDDDPCWDAITHWRKRTPGPETKDVPRG